MSELAPLMRLEQISKTFGRVAALRGVDLDIERGRVHGLLGANGAGKSTLIKILAGNLVPTGGRILWKGSPVQWANSRQANAVGIATVHQHIPLAPTLSALENIFLSKKWGWRNDAAQRKRYGELCDRVGYWLDPDQLVGSLSIGQRQMVAILQALGTGAELIVLDEPTASLAAGERETVYEIILRLSRAEGKAILFVSHFLDEIIALTDCVTVLRDGQAVMRAETRDLNEAAIAEAIVGRQIVALEHSPRREPTTDTPILLELKNIVSPKGVAPISLQLRAGEVIGLAGLLGSGRSEILHAIFGADTDASGEVLVKGKPLARSTTAAVAAGLALVPEDRLAQGLFRQFEIWRNTTFPALESVSDFGWFPRRDRERERGSEAIRRLAIKASSPDTLVAELSGGNAQKVTIAKWLFSDVDVFLLDEPTAGIDIGAKTDILLLVRELAAVGKGVIIVSSDFEELLAVSSRILIVQDGLIVDERRAYDTSEHELVVLAGATNVQKPAAEARRR